MKDFVIIKTYTYPHEYAVLKLLLDKERISYFFENETMIGVFPFYSNALGGINLKVHQKDKAKVLQIIDNLNTDSHLTIV
ncbi:DUF2007 domain-containing protein [Aquimarina sp. AD10]|uniref:DUF2007 domain-containing protein n=1 Tax=Aquimarina aggregata TaxID=1642818 RepID=A0A162Z4T8_9FLAO|nr:MULTISPECIES: hypothetical protein [Aquimarina]AXT61885.1 DUF2007 domain-containing protein [Aquimarina sp. AD10]KZS39559.1 hypothetical protein AWE51_07845 [Aquimarina aggregata]RKN02681.1 DUF2007 domain-containing protein [Aquimarina sp. AD10]